MTDNEVKLLQFIDAQLVELPKSTESPYLNGASHAFKCIKNYILEKNYSGKVSIESVLAASNLDNIEKNNE